MLAVEDLASAQNRGADELVRVRSAIDGSVELESWNALPDGAAACPLLGQASGARSG